MKKHWVYMVSIFMLLSSFVLMAQLPAFDVNWEPLLAVFIGLVIQGPGFWILGWMRDCRDQNEVVPLRFEPKYVFSWSLSLILTVIEWVVVAEKFTELMQAGWYFAITSGVGTQTLVRELAKFGEKKT